MSLTELAGGALQVEADAIARITLNAPARRNAISQAMWRALPAACAHVAEARAVIVAGAEGHFSAGADISEFGSIYADEETARTANAAVRAGQQALADLPCPVIAAVEGVCVGGGCGLALHADLRIAGEGARFAITPAKLGLAYSWEDTSRLVRTVGPAAAKDMLFSARTVAADEALRLGLVDRVVPAGQAEAGALAYAESLAALSPASLRVTKATVDAVASGLGRRDDIARAFETTFTGPDFAEGRSAFLEKRKPRF